MTAALRSAKAPHRAEGDHNGVDLTLNRGSKYLVVRDPADVIGDIFSRTGREVDVFLAGDIGATKTVLALFSAESGPRDPIAETRFSSGNFESLLEIVLPFLDSVESRRAADRITAAALGVAGPVIDDEAKITNLPWTLNREILADGLRLDPERVRLLNDLEAMANAVPRLLAEDIQTLNGGMPVDHAPIAVIAPGTGLGQAYLTWDGIRYRPHASEGGHVDFAPCNQLQLDLLNYLYKQYEHVSFERVVSGKGIPSIYRFLRDTGRAEEPDAIAAAMAQADDPTPIIMSHVDDYPICRQTLDVFVAILGAKSGNVALALMSRGGVYLGGGIPPRILPSLQSDLFLGSFSSKGRFSAMVSQIPVHVITNPKTALLGAAHAALALA
jgi:glucokinase